MSKSKRKLKAELREKRQQRAFFMWTGIITLICVVIAFFYFMNS